MPRSRDFLAVAKQPDVRRQRQPGHEFNSVGSLHLVAHDRGRLTASVNRLEAKPGRIAHPVVRDVGVAGLEGGPDGRLVQLRGQDVRAELRNER